MKIKKTLLTFNKKKPAGMLSRYRWLFVIYLGISLVIFLKLFFMKGSIFGGDWGFPDDKTQLYQYLKSLLYSWSHLGDIYGTRQLSPMSIIFVGPIYLFTLFGLKVSLIMKFILVLIFTLAASNMNLFLRYLKISKWPSFISGLVYITTPIFFNYSLMGWFYVLLSMALMPLFLYLFLRAINERRYVFALLASLVFTLAILQSQTMVWYPLIMLAVVLAQIGDLKKLLVSIKYFSLILISFILLNLYWLPSMLLLSDQGVAGSDIVKSTISIGTSLRLATYNIVRLWGSLFNYQFESSFPTSLILISFVLAFLGLISFLYYKKYKNSLRFLLIIFIIPFLFYFLDREIIAKLPFSNVIRDVARFSTVSTFALTALASITLNEIFNLEGRKKRWIITIIIMLLIANISPFLLARQYSSDTSGYDFRFRTLEWPTEYRQLEDKMVQDKLSGRAIFLPLGGLVSLTDDLRFNGSYKEITDVYAGFSPISGSIGFSDRSQGAPAEIINLIDQSINSQNIDLLYQWLVSTKVNYLVVRKDMQFYNWSPDQFANFVQGLNKLVENNSAEIYFDKGNILALKINSTSPFSVSPGLVEVNSGFSTILDDWVPPDVIDESDFSQTEHLLEIKKLFPAGSLFTFDGQNTLYGQYRNIAPSVYQFFSVGELNQRLLTLKWQLIQQNLYSKLDQGIRSDNEEIITKISQTNIDTKNNSLYLLDLDKASGLGKIYFQLDSDFDQTEVTINGKTHKLQKTELGNNIKYVEDLSPTVGINSFMVQQGAKPIFFIKEYTTKGTAPAITTSKINPTKYRLDISGINSDFNLEFADSFNQYWQIMANNGVFSSAIIGNNQHFVSNGYANGWHLSIDQLKKAGVLKQESDGSYSASIYLNFYPQRFLFVGSLASFVFLIFLILNVIMIYGKKNK